MGKEIRNKLWKILESDEFVDVDELDDVLDDEDVEDMAEDKLE